MNIFRQFVQERLLKMFPNEDPYCSFEESYPFVEMYFCNFIRILKLVFTEHKAHGR